MTLFDQIAERYDNWCDTPLGFMTEAYEMAVLNSLLPRSLAGLNVLDVGCGTGTWALHLATRGATMTGIDPSLAMIRVARRKAQDGGLPVTIEAADGSNLPFASVSFDMVALLILEFAPDPEAVLREMARVLRPGGTALLTTLNRNSVWTLLRRPEVHRAAIYYPPIASTWAFPLLRFLEAAGQRGLGIGPAYLAVRAIKPVDCSG